MCSIDKIMDMIDWNNPCEIQKKGRILANNVKCIDAFFQPLNSQYNKNVWDNCAIIISEKSDEELHPYLFKMFEWILDMNWPGALCIWNRLKEYKDKEWFNYVLNECIKEAKALKEDIWLSNLIEIKNTF